MKATPRLPLKIKKDLHARVKLQAVLLGKNLQEFADSIVELGLERFGRKRR